MKYLKSKNLYFNLKDKYPDYLVLIKVGVFYITFDKDATILNYLYNYQINKDKVGFPIKLIDKIITSLDNMRLNYFIYDNETEYLENNFNGNNYLDLLSKSKKKVYDNKMIDYLIERIKDIVVENPSNYSRIKDFIDEL